MRSFLKECLHTGHACSGRWRFVAVNAVKGIFGGGGDSSPAESSKQDQKRSSAGDDQISKALASLSKSGMLAFIHFFFSFFGACQNSNASKYAS